MTDPDDTTDDEAPATADEWMRAKARSNDHNRNAATAWRDTELTRQEGDPS